MALPPDSRNGAFLVGSAPVILGEDRDDFRFPAEHALEFELPDAIAKSAAPQRIEVTKVVGEAVQGIVVRGLLVPLGVIQAISTFVEARDIRCGLAVIKRRFLRALLSAGVCMHEIAPARLIYPADGPVCGYYHEHPDSVVPVHWLNDEITPSVTRAIAVYSVHEVSTAGGRQVPTAAATESPRRAANTRGRRQP